MEEFRMLIGSGIKGQGGTALVYRSQDLLEGEGVIGRVGAWVGVAVWRRDGLVVCGGLVVCVNVEVCACLCLRVCVCVSVELCVWDPGARGLWVRWRGGRGRERRAPLSCQAMGALTEPAR